LHAHAIYQSQYYIIIVSFFNDYQRKNWYSLFRFAFANCPQILNTLHLMHTYIFFNRIFIHLCIYQLQAQSMNKKLLTYTYAAFLFFFQSCATTAGNSVAFESSLTCQINGLAFTSNTISAGFGAGLFVVHTVSVDKRQLLLSMDSIDVIPNQVIQISNKMKNSLCGYAEHYLMANHIDFTATTGTILFTKISTKEASGVFRFTAADNAHGIVKNITNGAFKLNIINY
jgi:hypothetical protein